MTITTLSGAHLSLRATQCRHLANSMGDHATRLRLTEIAAYYEKLAMGLDACKGLKSITVTPLPADPEMRNRLSG
jgi:hypothetical protein